MILVYEFLAFGLDKLALACKNRNYRCVLFTENPNYYQSHLLEYIEVVQIDTQNPLLVIDYIKQNFTVQAIKGLVNSTDMFSLYAAEVAQEFNLVSNSIETLQIIRNKATLRQKCTELGLANVQSAAISSLAELRNFFQQTGNPIIFKNASGTGSQDIYKISTEQELDQLDDKFTIAEKSWVAEEFINGVLYSAESISYEGVHQLLGISSRTLSHEPLFQETSASFPAILPEQIINRIKLYIETLLNGLNYRYGFSHIEFMLKDNLPILIEVNPRLAGNLVGEMICDSLGQNIYCNMLNASLGENCLLDDLAVLGGASIAILYAPREGKIKSIMGTAVVNQFQNSRYYPIKNSGDSIIYSSDQRANYGVVYSFDLNSAMAFNKVQTIVNQISIKLIDSSVAQVLDA